VNNVLAERLSAVEQMSVAVSKRIGATREVLVGIKLKSVINIQRTRFPQLLSTEQNAAEVVQGLLQG
jgi:hypothetical protein